MTVLFATLVIIYDGAGRWFCNYLALHDFYPLTGMHRLFAEAPFNFVRRDDPSYKINLITIPLRSTAHLISSR